jgi:hypothetical protein
MKFVATKTADQLDLQALHRASASTSAISSSTRVISTATGSTLLPASTEAQPTGGEPRLSMIVLPFANLSGDPAQDYFADGITEDITTDLSRIPDSVVIARDTAFTFKGKTVAAKQIGHELGVRYVLQGSVRRAPLSGGSEQPAGKTGRISENDP